MAWWHRVGQKVVCVKPMTKVVGQAHGRPLTGFEDPLVVGRVYTVASVSKNPHSATGIAFELIEAPRDWQFGSHRFRPAVHRSSETGVAALRRHLIGAPVKEKAE